MAAGILLIGRMVLSYLYKRFSNGLEKVSSQNKASGVSSENVV
jgi:hypothetical protein